MLFSNPEVAAVMNSQFECVWRKAGDVARARIDFPDGTSMERTLGGNVITWICDADGSVIDVLPGLMDAPTYLSGLARGARMAQSLAGAVHDAERRALFRSRNETQSLGWGDQIFSQLFGTGLPPLQQSALIPASMGPLARLRPFPTESSVGVIDAFEVAVSKSTFIEDPIVKEVGRAKPDGFDGPLEEDSWIAENQLRPQALALLALVPHAPVDDFSPFVYRLVLHLDASDPHLGMENALLGRTDAFIPQAAATE